LLGPDRSRQLRTDRGAFEAASGEKDAVTPLDIDTVRCVSLVDRAHVAVALPAYDLGSQLGAGAFGLVLAGRHRGLDAKTTANCLKSSSTYRTNRKIRVSSNNPE